MAEKTEMQELIDAFLSYRNVLIPLQESLSALADSYDAINEDIVRLENAFGGETKRNINKVYDILTNQAKESAMLSERIEQFIQGSDKYARNVNALMEKFSKIDEKLRLIDELDEKAEEQIARLDAAIAERKSSYNVRDLQRTVETYTKNLEKVGDFINKDVVGVLQNNEKKLNSLQSSCDEAAELMKLQAKTMQSLLESNRATNEFIKNSVQNDAVNEEYIFAVLDKWAVARKVKIKK